MGTFKISIKEFRSLLGKLEERISEADESSWSLELEYGRETFVPTNEPVQFTENSKTGEKCVIIQITRDI